MSLNVSFEFFPPKSEEAEQALWRSIPRIEDDQERLIPISGTLPNPYLEHKGCPFFSRCEHRMPGLCDVHLVPMFRISPTHEVACFLYQP